MDSATLSQPSTTLHYQHVASIAAWDRNIANTTVCETSSTFSHETNTSNPTDSKVLKSGSQPELASLLKLAWQPHTPITIKDTDSHTEIESPRSYDTNGSVIYQYDSTTFENIPYQRSKPRTHERYGSMQSFKSTSKSEVRFNNIYQSPESNINQFTLGDEHDVKRAQAIPGLRQPKQSPHKLPLAFGGRLSSPSQDISMRSLSRFSASKSRSRLPPSHSERRDNLMESLRHSTVSSDSASRRVIQAHPPTVEDVVFRESSSEQPSETPVRMPLKPSQTSEHSLNYQDQLNSIVDKANQMYSQLTQRMSTNMLSPQSVTETAETVENIRKRIRAEEERQEQIRREQQALDEKRQAEEQKRQAEERKRQEEEKKRQAEEQKRQEEEQKRQAEEREAKEREEARQKEIDQQSVKHEEKTQSGGKDKETEARQKSTEESEKSLAPAKESLPDWKIWLEELENAEHRVKTHIKKSARDFIDPTCKAIYSEIRKLINRMTMTVESVNRTANSLMQIVHEGSRTHGTLCETFCILEISNLLIARASASSLPYTLMAGSDTTVSDSRTTDARENEQQTSYSGSFGWSRLLCLLGQRFRQLLVFFVATVQRYNLSLIPAPKGTKVALPPWLKSLSPTRILQITSILVSLFQEPALIQTQFDLRFAWLSLARIVNSPEKIQDLTPDTLSIFINFAGFELSRRYPRQFPKLLRCIHDDFFHHLQQQAPSRIPSNVVLKKTCELILKKGGRVMEEPPGRSLLNSREEQEW